MATPQHQQVKTEEELIEHVSKALEPVLDGVPAPVPEHTGHDASQVEDQDDEENNYGSGSEEEALEQDAENLDESAHGNTQEPTTTTPKALAQPLLGQHSQQHDAMPTERTAAAVPNQQSAPAQQHELEAAETQPAHQAEAAGAAAPNKHFTSPQHENEVDAKAAEQVRPAVEEPSPETRLDPSTQAPANPEQPAQPPMEQPMAEAVAAVPSKHSTSPPQHEVDAKAAEQVPPAQPAVEEPSPETQLDPRRQAPANPEQPAQPPMAQPMEEIKADVPNQQSAPAPPVQQHGHELEASGETAEIQPAHQAEAGAAGPNTHSTSPQHEVDAKAAEQVQPAVEEHSPETQLDPKTQAPANPEQPPQPPVKETKPTAEAEPEQQPAPPAQQPGPQLVVEAETKLEALARAAFVAEVVANADVEESAAQKTGFRDCSVLAEVLTNAVHQFEQSHGHGSLLKSTMSSRSGKNPKGKELQDELEKDHEAQAIWKEIDEQLAKSALENEQKKTHKTKKEKKTKKDKKHKSKSKTEHRRQKKQKKDKAHSSDDDDDDESQDAAEAQPEKSDLMEATPQAASSIGEQADQAAEGVIVPFNAESPELADTKTKATAKSLAKAKAKPRARSKAQASPKAQ